MPKSSKAKSKPTRPVIQMLQNFSTPGIRPHDGEYSGKVFQGGTPASNCAKQVHHAPDQYSHAQGSAGVPYAARIHTTKMGLLPSGDIVRRLRSGENLEVFDPDGNSSPVLAAVCNGKRSVKTVKFTNGTRLEFTGDFVVPVQNEGGRRECQVNDLAAGDKCLLSPHILLPDETEITLHGEPVSEDDAWMTGLMVGNGFSGRLPSSTSDTWYLRPKTNAQRERVEAVATEAGLSFNTRTSSKGYSIRGYGHAAHAYWERLGVWAKNHPRATPEWVMRAGVKLVTQYLRGLFESDGFVMPCLNERGRMQLSNTSRQVVETASWLLTSLGIFNTVSQYVDSREQNNQQSACSLRVNDIHSINRFQTLAGFEHAANAATVEAVRAYDADIDHRQPLLEVHKVIGHPGRQWVYGIQTGSGTFWYQGLLVHNCSILPVEDATAQ
jgi:hypothetical protein